MASSSHNPAPSVENTSQQPLTEHSTAIPTMLQSSLHAATRTLHMSLNKSITARLPLSLPPHASDPLPYYTGMLMFGQIFLTFEAAMEEAYSQQTQSQRNREIIDCVRIHGMARTERIAHDLALLEKRLKLLPSCGDVGEKDGEYITPEHVIRAAAKDYTRHIRENIVRTPYLALAYAWTMYLALFNGGRWLHRMLAGAGPSFWLEEESDDTDITALSFWHFDAATKEDPGAEKLKLEFKKRFDAASELLTLDEKDQVVEEARSVFELCSRMVDYLDEQIAEQQQQQSHQLQKAVQAGKPPEKQNVTSWSSPAAVSVWQGLTSKMKILVLPSWSTSWRKEVEVVK